MYYVVMENTQDKPYSTTWRVYTDPSQCELLRNMQKYPEHPNYIDRGSKLIELYAKYEALDIALNAILKNCFIVKNHYWVSSVDEGEMPTELPMYYSELCVAYHTTANGHRLIEFTTHAYECIVSAEAYLAEYDTRYNLTELIQKDTPDSVLTALAFRIQTETDFGTLVSVQDLVDYMTEYRASL